jgi:phenylpropionate dioxygenase-like ring-hydroxylating dioxygenase large terminal subunit
MIHPPDPYDLSMADPRASLVPGDYLDEGGYAAEVEHVLAASWLPVCRAEQIPAAGDRFAVSLCGRPVVAVRDAGGAVSVVANVCPHRGSRIVADGAGHDSVLVCPYHRWAYRLDGSFIGAPLAEGVDLEGVCLPPVRHVIWQGFVLVNLSGDAPDPFDDLAGLDDHMVPWRWGELVTVASETFASEWNWKVMVENWIECYHHVGTHRDSLEPFQPARTTEILPNAGAPWVAMTVQGVEGMEGDPDSWMPGLPTDRARELSVWSVFPLLLGGSISRYAFWLQVVPVDVTSHRVTWHLLAHPDRRSLFTPEAIEHEMEVLVAVHREDMATCRSVQEGLASGLVDQIRLTALEATIADFQRWVRARLP